MKWAAIFLCTILAGCASNPTPQMRLTTVAVKRPPAPKMAIPAECKAVATVKAKRISKVAGGTPVENTEDAVVRNITVIKDVKSMGRGCYCNLAAGNVTDADKAEARKLCAPKARKAVS